jgi:hypothetical protein
MQYWAPSNNTLQWRYQAEFYEISAVYRVRLCCEEAKIGARTIAQEFWEKEGARYVNIDMPEAERKARGIKPVFSIIIPDEAPLTSIDDRVKNFEAREKWMVDEIKKQLASLSKGDSALIICGSDHMESIAPEIRSRFSRVLTVDLTKKPWFDAKAFGMDQTVKPKGD